VGKKKEKEKQKRKKKKTYSAKWAIEAIGSCPQKLAREEDAGIIGESFPSERSDGKNPD